MELYNDSARRAQRYGRLISTADACSIECTDYRSSSYLQQLSSLSSCQQAQAGASWLSGYQLIRKLKAPLS